MRIRPITVLALAACVAAGAAQAASPTAREYAGTQRLLATLTPGAPTDCISLSTSRSSRYLDADTIVYRDNARRYYVNKASGGCSFSPDRIVITRTPSDRLCRGDIITLVDQGSRTTVGSCSLGDFVPYTR